MAKPIWENAATCNRRVLCPPDSRQTDQLGRLIHVEMLTGGRRLHLSDCALALQ